MDNDICLKVQEMSISGTTLKDRVESMLVTGIGSDCTFLVGDQMKEIRASQAFLIGASPVFERMFCGELPATEPIEVPEIEPDVFTIMLRFIYGCQWVFKNNDQAMKVCYVADKYMIPELTSRCEQHLMPKGIQDVWSALEVAELYSLEKLRHAAYKIIESNTKQGYMEVAESLNAVNLSHSCLARLIRSNALNTRNEVLVFQMCHRWATAKCREMGLPVDGENLRRELGEILYHIRFFIMTSKDFVTRVVKTGILTTEECLDILSYLATLDANLVRNNKFCTSTASRYNNETWYYA